MPFQPTLGVTMVDRRGRAQPARLPALPPPLHLIAGVFDWDALTWRDRLSVLRMRTPLRLARRALEPGSTRDRRVARRDRRELADSQRPDRAAARDALGSARAGRAQSAAVAGGGAGVCARARARCSGPTRRRRRSAFRPGRWTRCTPSRRAPFSKSDGCVVRTGAPAKIELLGDGRAARVERRGSVRGAGRRVRRALVCASPRLFDGRPGSAPGHGPERARDGVVADRDGQPLVRRPIFDEPFVGLPGRDMQWVFDKRQAFGDVGLSPVARVERRGRRSRTGRNDELIAAGARTSCWTRSLPRADRAAAPRHGHSRAAGDVLARARTAAASRHGDGGAGSVPRRRLDRHRFAGHDRERRSKRTSGR